MDTSTSTPLIIWLSGLSTGLFGLGFGASFLIPWLASSDPAGTAMLGGLAGCGLWVAALGLGLFAGYVTVSHWAEISPGLRLTGLLPALMMSLSLILLMLATMLWG